MIARRRWPQWMAAIPVSCVIVVGATPLTGCGDEAENISNTTVSTEAFDVSAGLRNALITPITHQVSATDSSGTTVVRLTIEPKGEVTLSGGSTVNLTESVNQTTSPAGVVTESKTLTYWTTDPANDNRVRIVSIETPASKVLLSVTSSADLPGPVLVNTNGTYYDGLVTENTVRIGSASVNWALRPHSEQTAWACTVASTTYSSGVFSDCYLINPAGELQSRYQYIVTEGIQGLVFQ